MALNDRFVLQNIVQLHTQYKSLSYLMSKIGSPVKVNKQLVEMPYNDWATVPVAQSTGVTLSNQNTIATVTFQGAKDIFANKFTVTENVTGTVAKVISHAAGSVVLQFYSSPVAGVSAFTSSDFASGNTFTQSTVAPIDYNESRSTESQYYLPDLRKIVIGTFTKSVSLSKKDMIETNRIKKTVANGIQYLAWSQVERMLADYVSGLEYQMLTSNQVLPNQNGDGGSIASLPWQIQNEGGLYIPMTSAPDQSVLKQASSYIRDQKGKGGEIMLCGGSDLIGALQSDIARSWLTYTGDSNTFGGKTVDGINFKEYTYLDVKIKFYTDFNDFNHPNWFPTLSNITGSQKSKSSFFAFDTDMVEGNDGMLPFLTNYYYGLESDTSDGKYQVTQNGNIDENGAFPTNVTGDTPVVTYAMHGTAAPTLTKPQNCVFGELVS